MERERRTRAFRTQAGVVASRRGGALMAGHPLADVQCPLERGWQCLVGMKCPLSSWEAHQPPRSECARRGWCPRAMGTLEWLGQHKGQHCHPSLLLVGLLWEKWDKIAINLREQASFSHAGSSPLRMSEAAGCFRVVFGFTVEKTVRH